MTRSAILVLPFLLAACVSTKPVNLSEHFTPPRAAIGTAHVPAGGACVVTLAHIRDLRSDTQSMGYIGARPVRAADTAAWLRSGFQSLNRDPRIKIADGTSGASGLVLNVEMLKAYMISITTDKSATLVLRVRYTAGNAPVQEQIYRGTNTSSNWDAGDGETQTAFDAALEQALLSIDADIVARCAAASAKP